MRGNNSRNWTRNLLITAFALALTAVEAQANDVEQALTIGAPKSAWDTLRDNGGIRDTLYGISITSVRGNWDSDSLSLISLLALASPTTAPVKIRYSLDRVCNFKDAAWNISNVGDISHADATQSGWKCGYTCNAGGRGLVAGQVVTTGAFGGSHPLPSGARVKGEIAGFASVDLEVVA